MPRKKLVTGNNKAAYDELSRSIAHKIKNQLTILLTSAELASKQLENKGEVEKFVRSVENKILRLISITEAMLKHGRREKND